MHTRSLLLLATLLMLGGGCTDYHNRTYRYGEGMPLKPFVVTVTQASLGTEKQWVLLAVDLVDENRSGATQRFDVTAVTLRVGRARELPQDLPATEPGEARPGDLCQRCSRLHFRLRQDELAEPLALVVGRTERKGKTQLTLVALKGPGMPRRLPAGGEWLAYSSRQWK